jgi:hypothetical protein
MADTLPNIALPAGVWVDLYGGAGIAVGTKIYVENLTEFDVRLCSKGVQPTAVDGFALLVRGQTMSNQGGDAGAWAMSPVGSLVNVRS